MGLAYALCPLNVRKAGRLRLQSGSSGVTVKVGPKPVKAVSGTRTPVARVAVLCYILLGLNGKVSRKRPETRGWDGENSAGGSPQPLQGRQASLRALGALLRAGRLLTVARSGVSQKRNPRHPLDYRLLGRDNSSLKRRERKTQVIGVAAIGQMLRHSRLWGLLGFQ